MPETLEERPPVFVDTVTLSNFALAERVDLLTGTYGERCLVTSEVRDEIAAGVAAGYAALTSVEDAIVAKRIGSALLRPEERKTYQELLGVLSSGEASCVAGALHRGCVVATDDRAARACASQRGIPTTGTIGILMACCHRGILAALDADEVLRAMIAEGFRSPVSRVSDLL